MEQKKKINPKIAYDTYYMFLTTHPFKASCGRVRDFLRNRDYVSLDGAPLSRMAVWRALQSIPGGKELLLQTKKRMTYMGDDYAFVKDFRAP